MATKNGKTRFKIKNKILLQVHFFGKCKEIIYIKKDT